ncbi:MAG: hypothetical protein U9N14_01145 [Pseudomonadota bacterium]|nr:hypothetical protein [Pseudomonadota bacterium]
MFGKPASLLKLIKRIKIRDPLIQAQNLAAVATPLSDQKSIVGLEKMIIRFADKHDNTSCYKLALIAHILHDDVPATGSDETRERLLTALTKAGTRLANRPVGSAGWDALAAIVGTLIARQRPEGIDLFVSVLKKKDFVKVADRFGASDLLEAILRYVPDKLPIIAMGLVSDKLRVMFVSVLAKDIEALNAMTESDRDKLIERLIVIVDTMLEAQFNPDRAMTVINLLPIFGRFEHPRAPELFITSAQRPEISDYDVWESLYRDILVPRFPDQMTEILPKLPTGRHQLLFVEAATDLCIKEDGLLHPLDGRSGEVLIDSWLNRNSEPSVLAIARAGVFLEAERFRPLIPDLLSFDSEKVKIQTLETLFAHPDVSTLLDDDLRIRINQLPQSVLSNVQGMK